MKSALFIGGTGTISAAITKKVAASPEWKLYLLYRGNRCDAVPEGVEIIKANINDEADVASKTAGMHFDCVCDFIGFVPAHAERDWRLFKGRTEQYMFISSASAYMKPCPTPFITEDVPLENPFWEYSRGKQACEEFLFGKWREEGFPVTVIRPSHTYDERKVPIGIHGNKGNWSVIKRILDGKPVLIQGDGTSLWTMTHNSDFAKGFFGLMGNPKAIGEAFHITSDESLTWNQIYDCIGKALGKECLRYYVPSDFLGAVGAKFDLDGALLGDKSNTVIFDNSKVKALVPEFVCTIPYEKGVKMTIDNVLAHPELQVEDPEFDQWCDRVIDALERCKASLSE